MKKIFFLFFAISLLGIASCSDDNGGSSSGGASNLSKVRIKNASSLLTASSTRSTTSDILLKQNADGSVSPVYFIKENGDSLTMSVSSVSEFGSRYLLMSGNFQVKDKYYSQILVDKETESIYSFPYLQSMSTENYTDNGGNIYFKAYESGDMIYKLDISDPNNVSLANYIPTNQTFTKFMVSKTGVCFYGTTDGKFKLPSGAIVPLTSSSIGGMNPMAVFLGYDDTQYYVFVSQMVAAPTPGFSYIYYKILKLNFDGGALSYTLVVDYGAFRLSNTNPKVLKNPVRHTMCIIDNDGVLDFNDAAGTGQRFAQTLTPFYQWNSYSGDYTYQPQTSTDFILRASDNTHITKLSMANYTTTDVALAPSGTQEIYSLTASPSSNSISFSSLRYSDGQNVIGTINAQNVASYSVVPEGKPTILLKLY